MHKEGNNRHGQLKSLSLNFSLWIRSWHFTQVKFTPYYVADPLWNNILKFIFSVFKLIGFIFKNIFRFIENWVNNKEFSYTLMPPQNIVSLASNILY